MRPITVLLCTALTCAASAGSGAAAAEVYRWDDAQGVTHYSDTPPPEGTEHVRIDAPAPAPEPAAADEVAAAESGPVAVSRENCERARNNMATLQDSPVVRMDLDGDGESDELDEAQRAEQLELAQRQVQAFCGE